MPSGLAWDDLGAVLPSQPDGVLLPKGEPPLLAELDGRLRDMEHRHGLDPGRPPVWVLTK
jgi:citrate lyase beta subunit